jgi:hypothetical protein
MYPPHTGENMSRRLNDAERRLMNHVNMWGSAGYPIRKLGAGRWVWGTDDVKGPPTVFKTKTAAVESFKAWRDLMCEYLGEEAKERAIADLRARGWTEEEIQAACAREAA